jgi:hypothetical protein
MNLGDALYRDWSHWNYEYTLDPRFALHSRFDENSNIVLIRQTFSPGQELIKIKHILRVNAMEEKQRYRKLWRADGVFYVAVNVRLETPITILFIIVFFLSVRYSRRKIKMMG